LRWHSGLNACLASGTQGAGTLDTELKVNDMTVANALCVGGTLAK